MARPLSPTWLSQGGWVRGHAGLWLLMAAAAIPLFAGLGDRHLWADEGDTAVLAATILEHGVPSAWDGRTFTDSDYGARVNERLVMVGHPWLPYYAVAASFALFGESAWSARLPFAVSALLTLPALYFLVRRFTDRRTALLAVLFLALSVQFLLFARQSRGYALGALLTCLCLLAACFVDTRAGRLSFAATWIALFHAHPMPAVAALLSFGMLAAGHSQFHRYRRGLALATAMAAPLTLPWFVVAQGTLRENTSVVSLDQLRLVAPRFVQFAVEWSSVTPIVGWLLLALVVALRRAAAVRAARRAFERQPVARRRRVAVPPGLRDGPRQLAMVVGAFGLATGALASFSLSAATLYTVGCRHFAAVIPLGAAMTAVLVMAATRSQPGARAVTVAVLAFTNLGRVTPWAFAGDGRHPGTPPEQVALHVPLDRATALFQVQIPAFVSDLWGENRGTVAEIVGFLDAHASSEDIVITNYAWEPLYFHTGLRQGLKIMRHYPVYAAARERDLPDYVFGVDRVRWIAWRWPWNGYREYDLDRIARELQRQGAVLTPAASFPETVWENRENIHFYRFRQAGSLYPFAQDGVNADIFRVDWPGDRAAAVASSS